MFAVERLEELVVQVPFVRDRAEYIISFLDHVAQFTPRLQSLTILFEPGGTFNQQLHQQLETALAKFRSIKHFAMPVMHRRDRDLQNSILKFKDIRTICLPKSLSTGTCCKSKSGEGPGDRALEPFHKLTTLHLEGLENGDIFPEGCHFPALTKIKLQFAAPRKLLPDGFLKSIQTVCPGIRELSIIDSNDVPPHGRVCHAPVMPADLKGFLVFANLQRITISHPFHSAVNNDHITEFLSHLPQLKAFDFTVDCDATLGILSRIAVISPNLEVLRLQVKICRSEGLLVQRRFEHLKELDLVKSPLQRDGQSVAFFLAQLLPQFCMLRVQGQTQSQLRDYHRLHHFLLLPMVSPCDDRTYNWNTVTSIFPSLLLFRELISQ